MDMLIIFIAKYLFIANVAAYLIFSSYLWLTNMQKFTYFSLLSVLSFFFTYGIGKLLSFIISDPRPFVNENISPLITHAANNGFPSLYTLITIAIASVVFVYQKKLGALLFIIALLIGIARVLAYVVHPIDIIGAILIGVSVTTFFFTLIKLHAMYNNTHLF